MITPDLKYYGLRVNGVSEVLEEFPVGVVPVSTTLTLTTISSTANVRVEQFASDMEVMNKVRESHDPAVKAAYEQLLTVMALTNGRVHTDKK